MTDKPQRNARLTSARLTAAQREAELRSKERLQKTLDAYHMQFVKPLAERVEWLERPWWRRLGAMLSPRGVYK